MVNKLTVTSVKIADNRLTISFSCKGKIQNYFIQNQFLVEYNTSIEGVPEAILVIPFLASICPVAWAVQADVYVDEVDETFLRSLDHIQKTLQKFYPEMNFNGKVYAKKTVTPENIVQTNSMMLFSGGIDGLATYFRHKAETPILFSVHGFDMAFNDGVAWKNFTAYVQEFANENGAKFRTASYNFLTIVDRLLLREFIPKISGYWEEKVMQGLSLLGLCAPVAYVHGVEKLYIASTFTDEFQMPCGSHPEIDNYVKWTGTNVFHDASELSRQEKLEFLADYLNNKNPNFHLRVCTASKSDKNCGKCEKCIRTILGLELASVNPNNHGFDVNNDDFLFLKEKMSNFVKTFGAGNLPTWIDLQRHATSTKELPHPGARVLIDWLLQVNFKTLRQPQPKASWLIPFFKYLPHPIYQIVKRIYIAFNRFLLSERLI